MRSGSSRKAVEGAMALLDAIAASGEPADRVRHAWMRDHHKQFDPAERAALIQLSEQVLRHRGQLDWWITRDKGGLTPDSRLRVCAFRILSTGAKAASQFPFFQSDEVKEAEFLRRLERHTLDHPDMPLTARLNIPDWILPHFKKRFGVDLELELTAMLRPAPLDVRINPLKTTRDAAAAALAAEELRSQPTPYSPLGLRLSPQAYVNNGQAYADGLIEPQDEGSQIAAQLADAANCKFVVDFCAGAGGKTLVLAAAMRNVGRLVAMDVSAGRLTQARLRLRRAGVHNAETRELDSKWIKRHSGQADRVLVDAPCTGTGTWRRKPDAKWRLTPKDLEELVPRQAEILDRAARLVKPQGRLIYVTCSVLREENDDQVAAFLKRHPDFKVMPVTEVWPQTIGGACPVPGPYLALSPARHGTDGFFAAILVRHA
ncbi:RsmB/NOP family class I SAM-dependent RNA methyltransferase [uncultured Ferrovibrio sp.]|jgi:16S rRNA (cytosine967-C5)-methyltransferase|uniref:RsmB/NOP family class I SAM-dependent RNA methyltransferase n=1 Tax=uncultured Ferrovibrio sp. TaxID=1576913 RepID=UPI00261FEF43|nr:RsmB/NOP family class I SAM-dependent RNA methyltransferase [uncultured Ferrovibrio sp.]